MLDEGVTRAWIVSGNTNIALSWAKRKPTGIAAAPLPSLDMNTNPL